MSVINLQLSVCYLQFGVKMRVRHNIPKIDISQCETTSCNISSRHGDPNEQRNLRLSSDTRDSTDHGEQKSGVVFLMTENSRRVPLLAKVYNNRLDHYMLLSSNRQVNPQQKYINLKHSHVDLMDNNIIRITSTKDIEGQSLQLRIPYEKDIQSWMSALGSERCRTPIGSPIIPRSPLMPTLQESDEDSDDC